MELTIFLAQTYPALTYVDDVHSVRLYGPRGAGFCAELRGLMDRLIIQGTLAKAFGVIGGYIGGKQKSLTLLEAMRRSYAPEFILLYRFVSIYFCGCDCQH